MRNSSGQQTRSVVYFCIFIVWLVINIRVEAGFGTTFERALDGLAGGGVLLGAIVLALRFFGDLAAKDGEGDDR